MTANPARANRCKENLNNVLNISNLRTTNGGSAFHNKDADVPLILRALRKTAVNNTTIRFSFAFSGQAILPDLAEHRVCQRRCRQHNNTSTIQIDAKSVPTTCAARVSRDNQRKS